MISLDFDGVLIDRPGIPRKGDYMCDKPMKDALEAVWWLERQGFKPYVLTARRETQHPEIEYWLYMHGFPDLKVTNKKLPDTVIYLDDRAVRFQGWRDFIKLLG